MNLNSLPVVELEEVWHIGTLNAVDKGCNFAHSHEGAGLSVSVNPDAWEAIAKLGGYPWWVLSRKDGRPGRFINLIAIRGARRSNLTGYAVERGLLTMQPRWEVSYFDEEAECRSRFLYATPEEAREEKAALRESDESVRSRKIVVPCPTDKLKELVRQDVSDGGAFAIAVTALAEEMSDIDGVWWDDALDVLTLRAPAGAISVRAMPEWNARPVKRFETC